MSKRNFFSDLFNLIDVNKNGVINKSELLRILDESGLRSDNSRLAITMENLSLYGELQSINISDFIRITKKNIAIIKKALQHDLVITDFDKFRKQITRIYKKIKQIKTGKVADYIPQLKKVDVNKLAVSVCTIDGQQFSLGDAEDFFCMESACKHFLYSMALEEHGETMVHKHMGREASGRQFNAISLNKDGLPHNPMLNTGAIMSCSLIKQKAKVSDKFEHVIQKIKLLSGGQKIGFNNAVYLSERETADRNFSLGYLMQGNKAFPKNTDLIQTLELYFQCCSIEVSTRTMAVIAANLANAGICPLTGLNIFSPETVKNCLSLMYSCGMYDYSGEWAFLVGLPAKSGISGVLICVIPDVAGFCVWSPALDSHGNPVKGIQFFKDLIKYYNFHNYDSLIKSSKKIDPRKKKSEVRITDTLSLLLAASVGDMSEVLRLTAAGVDLNSPDYDGRTALHLAASEGHLDVVKYLILKGVASNPVDRWHGTPLSDAKRENHFDVVDFLKKTLG